MATVVWSLTACTSQGPDRKVATSRTDAASEVRNGANEGAPSSGPATRTMPSPTAPSGVHPPGPQASASGGVEVLPETPGASPSTLPGLASTPPPRSTPLISKPLPREASVTGAFVSGYPRKILPKAPHSSVVSSSVSPSGSRLQVTLTSESRRLAPMIERYYRVHLTSLGFGESPPSTAGPATTLRFHRASDSVVLTLTKGGGLTYTLFASLTA